jgi:hypothetical protein
VDSYELGKIIPRFELVAKVSGKKKEIPILKHQMNLRGAKYPNNVIVINLPAHAGGMN